MSDRLCIVPAKPLARAKARLAPVLGPADRRTLVLAMLADVTASALQVCPVWVLCSDEETAEVARDCGALAVADPTPDRGLNASLTAATALAADTGALLILSSDLPCVLPEDVEAMFGVASVVIAPDRAGEGTNALLRSPPDIIGVAFGEHSRRAHEALARDTGSVLVTRPGLTLDVDLPDDLRLALDEGAGPATRAALAGIAVC